MPEEERENEGSDNSEMIKIDSEGTLHTWCIEHVEM